MVICFVESGTTYIIYLGPGFHIPFLVVIANNKEKEGKNKRREDFSSLVGQCNTGKVCLESLCSLHRWKLKTYLDKDNV